MNGGQNQWKVVLIVEDDSDGRAISTLMQNLQIRAVIDWLPANGLGNIQRNGRKLVALAKDRVGRRGCVAVIIDGDSKNPARDEPHRTIARDCRASNVPLVIARESLEAWLLADRGICEWLEVPTRPTTHTLGDPKDVVSRAFLRKTGRPYRQRRARLEVAKRTTGLNRAANISLDTALRHLERCRIIGNAT
jgi:hypothetical protein